MAGRAKKKLVEGEVTEGEWGGDRASREPVQRLNLWRGCMALSDS